MLGLGCPSKLLSRQLSHFSLPMTFCLELFKLLEEGGLGVVVLVPIWLLAKLSILPYALRSTLYSPCEL